MKSEDKVVPMHASAFFSVARDGEFHQLLQYDYYDPDGFYASLLNKKMLSEELKKLWMNMQGYLEEEVNKVNGEVVSPQVKFCDIQFRGQREHPFIVWIISFKGNFQKGINLYETKTAEEKLEYSCYALWEFPQKSKITKVDSKLFFDIFGNRMVLWGEKDMIIGGFERIQFEIY